MPVQVVHSEGPHLVPLVVVYTTVEIIGRGLSSALSVVDPDILGGIVLTWHSLVLVLVEESRAQLIEEVGLLDLVEVHIEVHELVLAERVVHLLRHILFCLCR